MRAWAGAAASVSVALSLVTGCALPMTPGPDAGPQGNGSQVNGPQSTGSQQKPTAKPGGSAAQQVRRPAGAQQVEIAWISDGDTVAVRALRRGVLPRGVVENVRLLEIDTPESKDPDLPVQCFALRAAKATERMLPPGSVAWVVPDQELRDRYGRALLYVWNAKGVFVNERLVRRGFAKAVLFRPNDRYIDLMRDAEAGARAAGRGVWSACP